MKNRNVDCSKADQALANGHPELAIDLYQKTLKKIPTHYAAKSNLGLAYFHLGQYETALKIFEELYLKHPEDPAILNRIGVTNLKLGVVDKAETLLLKASSIDPKRLETWINLCYVAGVLRQFKEGMIYAMRAVEIDPKNQEAYINLGAALMSLGNYDAALIAFETVIDLNPENLLALSNIASVYSIRGESEKAIRAYEDCIQRNPTHPQNDQARFFLSTEYLRQGRLTDGWAMYDYGFGDVGFNSRTPPRKFAVEKWDGSNLPEQTLMIWREQGLGDEIMFFSCLPEVLSKCKNVIIECDPRMVTLFQRSFPEATVRPQAYSPAPSFTPVYQDFDHHIPAGSLMRFFRNQISDFERSKPYLIADPTLVARYKNRLGSDHSRLRVGICWRSGLMDTQRNTNYASLSDWQAILRNPNCVFVNLQYGDCKTEIENAQHEFNTYINHWPDVNLKNDLEDVAAIIAGLDLVITAGTAVAQMAGALGVPVFMFAPKNSWTNLGQDYFPWYSNISLFSFENNQPQEALDAIAIELSKRQ
jgi:tetratricopeptide (TPR) repeat protein